MEKKVKKAKLIFVLFIILLWIVVIFKLYPIIKEFKEPRLMAKWDSSENLPSIFKKHNINILPISRTGYVLSDFKLYEPIPELGEHITEMQKVEIPEYETIDIGNISSEANAINVLMLSKIL